MVSTPPFHHRLLTGPLLDGLDFLTRRQPPEPPAPIAHQAASPPPRDPTRVAQAGGTGIFIDRDKVGRTPRASPPCCIEHRRTTAQGQLWDEVSARPLDHTTELLTGSALLRRRQLQRLLCAAANSLTLHPIDCLILPHRAQARGIRAVTLTTKSGEDSERAFLLYWTQESPVGLSGWTAIPAVLNRPSMHLN